MVDSINCLLFQFNSCPLWRWQWLLWINCCTTNSNNDRLTAFNLCAWQQTVTSGQSNFTQSRIAPCTNCANICSQKMLRLNAVNNKHLCAALTAMPTQRHVTFFVLVLWFRQSIDLYHCFRTNANVYLLTNYTCILLRATDFVSKWKHSATVADLAIITLFSGLETRQNCLFPWGWGPT